jgi:hypothetical protein
MQLGRADQHARHIAPREQPGNRGLRDARAMLVRNLAQALDQPKAVFLVERQHIESGKAVVGIRQRGARVLAA